MKSSYSNPRQFSVFAIAGMLALLLAGCGDRERQKLIGVWEIETADKLIDRVGGDDPPESDAVPMTIEFGSRGQLVTTTQVGAIGKVKTGDWELIRSEADRSFVRCTLTGEHIGTQTSEVEIEWLDSETIKMTPPNMAGLRMKLRFSRQQ